MALKRTATLILAALMVLSPAAAQSQTAARLDTTTFITVGESLAAGVGDFSLHQASQHNSFPALLARQMGAIFPQPLIQAPGLGGVPGFPEQPVMVPAPGQTTVRAQFPPTLFIFNLAVPGHRLVDALRLQPRPPLVQSSDARQTATNVILGYPSMILGSQIPLWSQVQYAEAMNPTLVLVELGYAEALAAAAQGDANLIPAPADFAAGYRELLGRLRANYSTVIATTIPDPTNTAYCSTLADAAQLAGVPAATLAARYALEPGDLLLPAALTALGAGAETLPARSVLRADTAAAIRRGVQALNAVVAAEAGRGEAILYDLHGLLTRLRSAPLPVGSLRLSASYLGGIYTLSGAFTGATTNALIANEIIALLNQKFQAAIPAIDLADIARTDPAVRFRPTELSGASTAIVEGE